MGDISQFTNWPSLPTQKIVDSPDRQLKSAMLSAGIDPPDHIIFDGKIHRFRSGTKGKSSGDKTGWYVAFDDGFPAGRFGCWRAGVESSWRAEIGRKFSAAEEIQYTRRMAEAKALRDAEREKLKKIAEDCIENIWDAAPAASADHPYLARKKIQPHGARITGDGRLIVPLYNADGELSSLQYISHDGEKRYHTDAQTGSCFNFISQENTEKIYIAEGFATAATIHELTGFASIAAYSASNLVNVTEIIQKKYGKNHQIIIVADNDKSGTGQKYADQACAKFGVRMVIPPVDGDINDYHLAGYNARELLVGSQRSVIDELQLTFGDQLPDEYEAPDEIIEGLIVAGSQTVIYGDSNSGKTFFALSLATAIAEGRECYNRKTEQGLVVYLATEAPASIRARMQAIKRHLGCTLSNLAIVPVPINFYDGDSDAIAVVDAVRQIEMIKKMPVRLIVGDTLARMCAGANENSGEDMGPVMSRFDRVATATGAAMVIIHHTGKDQARGARGWSGIRAHIDTEIEVSEKNGARVAEITKQRELSSKGSSIKFKLDIIKMGQTKFGSDATTCVAVPDNDSASHSDDENKTKRGSSFDDARRILERAWFATGADEMDGMPYLSRAGLRQFFINDGYSERSAKNRTETSHHSSITKDMLSVGFLIPKAHGWVFACETYANSMLIRKNAGL